MVIVIEDSVIVSAGVNTEKAISFHKNDGDIYNSYNAKGATGTTAGSLYVAAIGKGGINVNQFGKQQDKVRVIARKRSVFSDKFFDGYIRGSGSWQVTGYIKKNSQWHKAKVIRIPAKFDMFARGRGLFESDLLKDKTVLLIGLGSGGAPVALGLAQLGIGKIIIMDDDRLEPGNITRHPAGLKDIGRQKTDVMREMILDINPFAQIIICNEKVTQQNQDKLAYRIAQSDVVINAADDPKAKIIINRICIKLKKPLIMGGCFSRAYGGQILYIRPGQTLCHQCFLNATGEETDTEISNQRQADAASYSDMRVPVEPGLANDVVPFSQMIVKLTLTELLKDKKTTLKSLNDDFQEPAVYLWLNRREMGTPYEKLLPMGFGFGDMSIMRWYGLPFPKDPVCPCCGDIVCGIKITDEDKDFFQS